MVSLITGAAGGLGRHYVNYCAKEGYEIIAVDINVLGLMSLQKGIKERFGKQIDIRECDVTNEDDVLELINYLSTKNLKINMLFNVAGTDYEGGFLNRSFKEIEQVISLNILGTLRMTHHLLNSDQIDHPFYLLVVSSLAAKQPIPLKATYAASKRFLLDFYLALKEETRRDDIKILIMCPGGLTTNENVVKAILGQGFFGAISTCRIEKIVKKSIYHLQRGKKCYIPGWFNQLTAFLNPLIPVSLTTRMLYKRWSKAQATWLTKGGDAL